MSFKGRVVIKSLSISPVDCVGGSHIHLTNWSGAPSVLSVVDRQFTCGRRDAVDGLSSDEVKSRVLSLYLGKEKAA